MHIQRVNSFDNTKYQSKQKTNKSFNNINFKSTYFVSKPETYDVVKIEGVLEKIKTLLNGEHLVLSSSGGGRHEVATFFERIQEAGRTIQRDISAYETKKENFIPHGPAFPYKEVTLSVPDEKNQVIRNVLKEFGIEEYIEHSLSRDNSKFLLFNINKNAAEEDYWYIQKNLLRRFMDNKIQPYRYLRAVTSNNNQGIEMEIRIPKSISEELVSYLKDYGIQDITISDKSKHLNYS